MTFRTSINSKSTPREFLKRGFKSMFSNYDEEKKAAPSIDADKDKEKRP